ncbi:uncharacterized protein LOC131073779 [Cryptomeria japonica]|uniref:uncharacterized protein LOC131073779 n=1 Tax=Cryptomeria japonica TaxID=3369 RepID=UPI0025AC8FDD|nr:uncharacterized protein LOC131073779 [Cryptomeria japonica]
METKFLRDKRFWFASFLITWAAALQAHMMWLRRQESFQEKFGTTKKKTQEVSNKEDKQSKDNLEEFHDDQMISEYQGKDEERLE